MVPRSLQSLIFSCVLLFSSAYAMLESPNVHLETDQECPICLESIGDVYREAPEQITISTCCKNFFCKDCVDPQKIKSCPLCRSEDFKIKKINTDGKSTPCIDIPTFAVHAAQVGNKKLLEVLIKKHPTFAKFYNASGHTPLTRACQFNQIDIVKYVEPLSRHIDICSRTPLFVASTAGSKDVAAFLTNKKLRNTTVNSTSRIFFKKYLPQYPVQAALIANQPVILSLILDAGAATNVKDHTGKSLFDIASELLQEKKYDPIVALLVKKIGIKKNSPIKTSYVLNKNEESYLYYAVGFADYLEGQETVFAWPDFKSCRTKNLQKQVESFESEAENLKLKYWQED